MKDSLIRIITVLLVLCASCAPAVPEPVETSMPTVTVTSTSESEAITPSATILVPSVTATQQPAATVTSPPPATDIPEPDQSALDFSKYGSFAYIVDTLGGMSIRMVNPDGSLVDWKFEAERDFFINEIAWSPDGSKFVLASDNGIYLLSIDDKALVHLPATNAFSIISSPSFSPDGKSITFFAYNEGAIFRINTDGTGLMNLTPDARYRNSYESPSWSFSGEQILFSRPYTDGSIYIMNTDGTAPRKLIDTGWNDQPRTSPDGKWLAFIRYNNESQAYLYAMPIGGGTNRLVSDKDHHVKFFRWSPDGRYLVYEGYVCKTQCNDDFNSWIVEFETGKTTKLKPFESVFRALEWSPLMKAAETREDCTDGWTRLAIGKLVHLIGNEPNRVRTEPKKGENVVGQFIADETYILLDGPVCAEGLVWWEIADPRLPGGSGWTAEGDGQEYWLEPINR